MKRLILLSLFLFVLPSVLADYNKTVEFDFEIIVTNSTITVEDDHGNRVQWDNHIFSDEFEFERNVTCPNLNTNSTDCGDVEVDCGDPSFSFPADTVNCNPSLTTTECPACPAIPEIPDYSDELNNCITQLEETKTPSPVKVYDSDTETTYEKNKEIIWFGIIILCVIIVYLKFIKKDPSKEIKQEYKPDYPEERPRVQPPTNQTMPSDPPYPSRPQPNYQQRPTRQEYQQPQYPTFQPAPRQPYPPNQSYEPRQNPSYQQSEHYDDETPFDDLKQVVQNNPPPTQRRPIKSPKEIDESNIDKIYSQLKTMDDSFNLG